LKYLPHFGGSRGQLRELFETDHSSDV